MSCFGLKDDKKSDKNCFKRRKFDFFLEQLFSKLEPRLERIHNSCKILNHDFIK